MRAELLLREPQSALLAARLEQLADAALVGGEARDLADDLADDLDALGGALLFDLFRWWWWRESGEGGGGECFFGVVEEEKRRGGKK